MTLEKGVEVLEEKALIYCRQGDSEFRIALKLGIEALKRIEDLRTYPDFDYIGALPSETEEAE